MKMTPTEEKTISDESGEFRIGWSEIEITPDKLPVLIVGQFHARLSEGVADPLMATACAFESNGEQVIFVTCDLIGISLELTEAVRANLAKRGWDLDPMKVILNATHTHTGPDICSRWSNHPGDKSIRVGFTASLGQVPGEDYVVYAAERIAECIGKAWNSKTAGGIAYGLDYAVVGRNRRWVDDENKSTMYGLKAAVSEKFRHIEGYEDHSLNLLATYDVEGTLTGLIVNLPCTSQEDENGYLLSADFWHETRRELRDRFGAEIFILPQVSAAGEMTSHPILEREAIQRMLELKGVSAKQEIAGRIADAVGRVLPSIGKAVDRSPGLTHRVEIVELPANRLTQAHANEAQAEVERCSVKYEEMKTVLEADPKRREEPRWYTAISQIFTSRCWHQGVVDRFERQKTHPTYPEEVHTLRLGEMAFATNSFEYYLDFGIQIKVRSPAIQTFLVQLAGPGTYVPSPRSVAGGGYGSQVASNPIGPEGGQVLAEKTIQSLRALWENRPDSKKRDDFKKGFLF